MLLSCVCCIVAVIFALLFQGLLARSISYQHWWPLAAQTWPLVSQRRWTFRHGAGCCRLTFIPLGKERGRCGSSGRATSTSLRAVAITSCLGDSMVHFFSATWLVRVTMQMVFATFTDSLMHRRQLSHSFCTCVLRCSCLFLTSFAHEPSWIIYRLQASKTQAWLGTTLW